VREHHELGDALGVVGKDDERVLLDDNTGNRATHPDNVRR